ncbi:hypothetical protein SCUCBS95973_004610 [Sporothrix curviconia]|uniref:Uncharacterized protein n=1 Tax=Sporothrix curviconia TaxID=1260050 RepID=A0ABP0BQ68_9PEZI
MPSAVLARLAFLLHAAVETPAAVTFLFAPERQLSPALLASQAGGNSGAEVLPVLQNLGGLLASSVALSLVMAVWGCTSPSASSTENQLRGGIALALGGYHIFPCRRAYLRRKYSIGLKGQQGKTLGGPAVHLVVHVVCLVAFMLAALVDFDLL